MSGIRHEFVGDGDPETGQVTREQLGRPVFAVPDVPAFAPEGDVAPELLERIQGHINAMEGANAEGTTAPLGLAVLFVDLENVKDINDTHTYDDGDRLINAAIEIMKTTIRHPESATKGTEHDPERRQTEGIYEDEVVRAMQSATLERKHGKHGDEFIILLVGVTSQVVVDEVIRRLQENLEAHTMDDIAPEGIKASIGGKLYEGETAKELVAAANMRMKRNKVEHAWSEAQGYSEEDRAILYFMVDWAEARGISFRKLAKMLGAMSVMRMLGRTTRLIPERPTESE